MGRGQVEPARRNIAVGPASIANFVPRHRSPPSEVRVMPKQLAHVATLATIRLGLLLFLLTKVRKSELQDGTGMKWNLRTPPGQLEKA